MLKPGPIEKGLYEKREKHPIIIPQIDPASLTLEQIYNRIKQVKELGIDLIAIGGTIIDPREVQKTIDILSKDFDMQGITYSTNSSIYLTNPPKGKFAIYWMNMPNAENEFFFRGNLIQNSISAQASNYEIIPTTYVFDDRGSIEAASWLARVNPIPRHKAYLSLAVALAAQYAGSRVYIMASGSGCKLTPPVEHIRLLREKTSLFIIPTSGIKNAKTVREMFKAGGDAVHIGKIFEAPNGVEIIADMIKTSKEFQGREF